MQLRRAIAHPLVGRGTKQGFPETGRLFHGLNAADAGKHPFQNAAVGIMIQAVHAGGGNAAVRQQAVPALPDGRCAKLDFIEPAGVILPQQKGIAQIIPAHDAQLPAQEGRADKAGLQGIVHPVQGIQKPLPGPGRVILQPEVQGQKISGLRVDAAAAGRRKILLTDPVQNFVRQRLIGRSVFCLAQQSGGLGYDQGAVAIIHIGNEALVRAAAAFVRFAGRIVQRQPVAVLVRLPPAVIVAVRPANGVYPGLHVLVALLKDGGVAEVEIQIPWDDAGRVAPCGNALTMIAEGRNDLGDNTARRPLFHGDIRQVFAVKGVYIAQIACRGGEHLRVARPTQPFIPLGTVGGHIQKIGTQPPAHVGDQLVEQGMARAQKAGLRSLRIHCQR